MRAPFLTMRVVVSGRSKPFYFNSAEEAKMIKNTDNNTWILRILFIAILILVVGAILMGVSGEPLSSINHSCF